MVALGPGEDELLDEWNVPVTVWKKGRKEMEKIGWKERKEKMEERRKGRKTTAG